MFCVRSRCLAAWNAAKFQRKLCKMGQDKAEMLKRIKFGTYKKTRAYLNIHEVITAH